MSDLCTVHPTSRIIRQITHCKKKSTPELKKTSYNPPQPGMRAQFSLQSKDGSRRVFVDFRNLHAKPRNRRRFLSTSPKRWMHQLAGRSAHILNLRCQLWLLASRIRQAWPRKDRLYQSLWPVPVWADGIWTKERPYHLLNGDDPYLLRCKVAIGFRLSRPYSRLFETVKVTSTIFNFSWRYYKESASHET